MIVAFAGLVVKKGEKTIVFDPVGNCGSHVSKFYFKLIENGGAIWFYRKCKLVAISEIIISLAHYRIITLAFTIHHT